jgi:DDE_Tnp_1-associated
MTLWKTVPAPTSSRIPTVAKRLESPLALAPDQCRSLLDDLAQIADPRKRRGRRHALGAVLAVAVAAVLAGARSLAAIGEWAADAPGPVLAALGVRRDPLRRVYRPPGEATMRRVLARATQAIRITRRVRSLLSPGRRPARGRRPGPGPGA